MSNATASVEKLLSVPLELIMMRAAPLPCSVSNTTEEQQQQQRPLILRSEAWSLLQVNLLSYEIDKLIGLSIESLSKMNDCFQYGEDLVVDQNERQKAYHFKLVALLPLLGSIKKCCIATVEYVTNEMRLIMDKLEALQVSLRQFSEQNLSIAEQLEEMMNMTGNTSKNNQDIVNEKKCVGKIELEICSRIEMLIETMNTVSVGKIPNTDNTQQVCDLIFEELFDDTNFVSMYDFCANSSLDFAMKKNPTPSAELHHHALIEATQPPATSDLCLSPTITNNRNTCMDSPIYDISKKRQKVEDNLNEHFSSDTSKTLTKVSTTDASSTTASQTSKENNDKKRRKLRKLDKSSSSKSDAQDISTIISNDASNKET